MKKNLLILAIAVLGFVKFSVAHAQNRECMEKLTIYSEYVKVKNYDAAYEPWKLVYETCPLLHEVNFLYGERILKDKIKKSVGEDKSTYVTMLLDLFKNSQQFLQKFPEKVKFADVKIDEALLKNEEKLASDEEIYAILHEGFSQDKKNFTDPKAIYLYFSVLVDLHKSGSKDLDEVFAIYDEVVEQIDVQFASLNATSIKLQEKEEEGTLTSRDQRMLKVVESNSKAFDQIAGSIDTKLGRLADCDNLIPLYQKNFEAKKGDVKWVKGAVSRMFSKECTDDPMFVKLVEAQTALAPSADTYFYLGMLKQKQGDSKEAVDNFNKAVELETNASKKSSILYRIALTYKNSSKSKARDFALKAIAEDGSNGSAYLLIANLYAGSANECGETQFEKRAIYWKAAEMAKKAGRVDLKLRERVAQTVTSYEAKAPTRTMIFESGMAGKVVSLNCWVGGSIKVPSLE